MWQIAQKDYKFGKGKHSSLTKATYDAVGDKFRSLWGKEAGWAHSVLFTADLRAFSERLSAKIEQVEVKQEENSSVLTETQVKAEVLTPVSIKSIKREHDQSDSERKEPLLIEEIREQRIVKRRRKT